MPPAVPLPARPPDGPDHGPRPGVRTRAVCCSGGGIRAAAFSLGGLQRLGRRPLGGRSYYDDVDLVTAVSGGSYTAAAVTLANHATAPAELAALAAYAPGSPEDTRLRTHTRYLLEDRAAAAAGVLGILYGLVLNLLPILAGLFLTGTVLGWVTRGAGVLELNPAATTWLVPRRSDVLVLCAMVAAAGTVAYTLDRWVDIYLPGRPSRGHPLRSVCLWLLGLAAVLFVLFGVVPEVLRIAADLRSTRRIQSVPTQSVGTGFVAACGVIVALVKATLGRFRGRLQASTGVASGGLLARLGAAGRRLAPWLGSALCALLLSVALLVWVNNAAVRGATVGGWWVCAAVLAGMALWQLTTDINRSSLHGYYADRLASAFAVRRRGGVAEPVPPGADRAFAGYAGDSPTLVVCAAVNTDQAGVVPAGRGCAPFTFSPHWTGISAGTMFDGERVSTPTRMVATASFGPAPLDLMSAVAVSGAAVSPVMGRLTRAPLRLLLGLANVRLGLWLPNPAHPGADRLRPGAHPGWRRRLAVQWRQPGIRGLLAEILGGMRLTGRWIYVTDGGHYENLGLVEALRRGATEVVVLDASGDPPNSWSTFGEAIETARADLGVEIDLDPAAVLGPREEGMPATLAAAGTFRYPNGVRGELYLCKLAMAADVDWDVQAWAASHPGFPHDSTAQQLYGDREFEAYRRLGELAAGMALDLMPASPVATVTLPPVAAGLVGGHASR